MDKILILNSPLFRVKNPLYDEDSLPPIGLGYIATILQQKGIEVKLIDAVFENIPLIELIQIIENEKPTYVATNIFTTNFELVQELVESVKNLSTKFIIGGLSTRTLYENICKWKTDNHIDIVFGDGEYITPDIITNCVQENPFYFTNNRRVFKVDNNSIYFPKDISNIPLNRSFFKNEPISHPFGFIEANIVTSRGCIYNCAFCAAARSLNKDLSIREKSTESIIKELEDIKILYPQVQSIRVLDDLFLKTKHTVEKAIEVFNNFDFSWRSMAHVMTFNGVSFDTLKLLKKSGCSELFIGIESGSPSVLKRIHKTNDLETIRKNLTNCLKAGISIKGYFIYGFPEETEDDFKKTFELANHLKNISLEYNSNFRTSVFQFRPYHGTELYHEIQNKFGEIPNVTSIEANSDLSDLVGRLQFNFHSGNYSNEDIETVHKYIYATTNLNSSDLFKSKK
jgi:anaerobic magnesium-protoporphyrin IX monomethyl ester cyclase